MLAGMHFAREDCRSDYLIRACEEGVITIGEQQYRHSLIVSTDRSPERWRPASAGELLREDLEPLCALQPEIVLIGTGSRLEFPSPSLTVTLLQAGIGVEVMDTAAACRTFNILLSEERRVVAALLLG